MTRYPRRCRTCLFLRSRSIYVGIDDLSGSYPATLRPAQTVLATGSDHVTARLASGPPSRDSRDDTLPRGDFI